MLSYQQRVVDEKKELDEKLLRLKAFCTSLGGSFNWLPVEEQMRLEEQLGYMLQYSEVLGQRIDAFSIDSNPV